jgi:putative endonuclease
MAYFNKKILGVKAEEIGCKFLQGKGLKLIVKNFYCRLGEIDLIMQDVDVIIFVEVRSKSSKKFITAEETINHTKQKKIIKTALYYLQQNDLLNDYSARFDVITVYDHWFKPQIDWIPNAFNAEILEFHH